MITPLPGELVFASVDDGDELRGSLAMGCPDGLSRVTWFPLKAIRRSRTYRH
jgi:hypothetical protein